MDELFCHIIPGPKPSSMDADMEAHRRGMGPLQRAGFSTGALRACGFPCVLPVSARAIAWDKAGEDWARAEIERRAGVKARSK